MRKIAVVLFAFLLAMLCSCGKNPHLKEVKYLESEDVIEYYFKSLEEHNLDMMNAVLYAPIDSIYWELEALDSIKANGVELSEELSEQYAVPGFYRTEVYIVDFNVYYKQGYEMFTENGNHRYYFVMVKDKRLNPWKVYSYNSLG